MSCDNELLISSLIDRQIAAEERENVLAHLESCAACSESYESMQSMRLALRRIAEPRMPVGLPGKLRQSAAYERVRNLSRASIRARRMDWLSRLQLAFENMMRPHALPFAGGFLSAALAFGLLVPNLSFAHRYISGGPATQIFNMPDGVVVGASGEPPRIEPADAQTSDYQTVVVLTVDSSGRVTDYQVTRGQLTDDLKELIMFSNFTPATFFGLPTTAKVRVYCNKIIPGMRS